MDQKHMLITAALCVIFFATGVLVGMRTGPGTAAQEPTASPPANAPLTMDQQKQLILQEIEALKQTIQRQGATLSQLSGILKQVQTAKKVTGSNAFDAQIQRVTSQIEGLNKDMQINMMRLNTLQGKLAMLS